MKLITILAIALTTFISIPATSRASDCGSVSYCAPVLLRTCEVGRCNECRWATDSCGRRFSYMVTVVTYRSYFSDGATRTFSRTYRA